jgi:hypothetical protein
MGRQLDCDLELATARQLGRGVRYRIATTTGGTGSREFELCQLQPALGRDRDFVLPGG